VQGGASFRAVSSSLTLPVEAAAGWLLVVN
jgi:hypothetical protein